VANFAHRLKIQNDINTDYIISGRYKFKIQDPKELSKHIFEDLEPDFYKKIKPGDFLVAGDNFGCGSSREQAPVALKSSGLKAVVAKSFARIFYRNSINIGLPLVECPGFAEEAEEGDEAEINLEGGFIRNRTSGREYSFPPYPEFLSEIIKAGGLMKHAGKERKK